MRTNRRKFFRHFFLRLVKHSIHDQEVIFLRVQPILPFNLRLKFMNPRLHLLKLKLHLRSQPVDGHILLLNGVAQCDYL